MEVNEIDKKDYPNRIEALVKYLSQGLYGQEDVIKELLLFALARRKVEVNADDEELKNIVLNRVYAAFKEFYGDENFTIPRSGDTLKSICVDKTPEENFFDFITQDIPELAPTEEQKSLLFSMDEVNAMQKEIKKIGLSDGVKRLILENRDSHSDTVWQSIIHVLQMSAFLNRRDTVCLSDFSIFEDDIKFYEEINYIEYLDVKYNKDIYIKDYFLERDKVRNFGSIFDINDYSIQEFEQASVYCSESEKEYSAVKQKKITLDKTYSRIIERLEENLQDIKLFESELDIPCIFSLRTSSYFSGILYGLTINFERTKTAMRSEYEKINFSFVKSIEIGDCIFKDGTHKKSSDVLKLVSGPSDVWGNYIIKDRFKLNIDIKPLVAIICIKGNTEDSLYGISQEGWTEIDFSKAEKAAESYHAKLSSVYSSEWLIPTIEQLEEIYQNREKITQEALGYKLSGKFWSSTKKEDEAVYFFDFDKGTKDYTTPDHKYNLALVHRFGEY